MDWIQQQTPVHQALKIKQRVSECFRTEAGARDFAVILSFAGTVKKHQLNILDAIKRALHKKIQLADIISTNTTNIDKDVGSFPIMPIFL